MASEQQVRAEVLHDRIADAMAMLDDFTLNLEDSGPSIKAVRVFLVNGIKQLIMKKKICLDNGEPRKESQTFIVGFRLRK